MQALQGRFVAQQIQGERDYQEDDFGLLDNSETVLDASAGGEKEKTPKVKEHTLMVLADGMGGHKGGGVASGIVTRTFLEIYDRTTGAVDARLQKALLAANEALAKAIENNGNLAGMGTTLVAVVATDEGLSWLSVGDSPLWLYRDGELQRLNEDHSMAPVLDDLVATGRLSVEEKNKDGRKNSLRSALMGDEISIVDTSSVVMPVYGSDVIILASDGLETLPEKTIKKHIKKKLRKGLGTCADTLISAVEKAKKKNQDNCTVVLYSPPQSDAEVQNNNGFAAGILAKVKAGFGKIGHR